MLRRLRRGLLTSAARLQKRLQKQVVAAAWRPTAITNAAGQEGWRTSGVSTADSATHLQQGGQRARETHARLETRKKTNALVEKVGHHTLQQKQISSVRPERAKHALVQKVGRFHQRGRHAAQPRDVIHAVLADDGIQPEVACRARKKKE